MSSTSIPSSPAANSVMQNLKKMELGKLAFTLASAAVLGLILSDKFPAAEALNFVILGFMAACALIWNGILFENMYLQFSGIALSLLSFYGLVGAFLPIAFASASWVLGAICLLPCLYILINPPPPGP